MRVALIFPTQWDPRQPPLAPAVLAATLKSAQAQVRVFDLNLALYRKLLKSESAGGIEDYLLNKVMNPASLNDAQGYLRFSEQAQKIFDEKFDPSGHGRLFWEAIAGLPGVASSSGWKALLRDPGSFPFIRHLKDEIVELQQWHPELIGISVISDTQLPAALVLAASFRQLMPECRIVMGGSSMIYRRSLLAELPWLSVLVDHICVGEGEQFLADLAAMNDCGDRSRAWASAPDFSVLPLADYLTPHLVMSVETARGCHWGRCAYCIHPVRTNEGRALYRQKPLQMVANEIQALFAAGHRRFFIVDEAIPPRRMRQLSDIFLALPGAVTWIGYARLDQGHSSEGFAHARESGCRKLFIGVESGSDQILAMFRKGVNSADARRVLLDVARAGIAAHFFLMTGFPQEQEADRRATLDLLADVLPEFDAFGFSFDLFALTAELETDLMADPKAFSCIVPERNAANDLAWQFPLSSGRLSQELQGDFKARIHQLADQILGPAFGLRHASLAQDSLHLLLLEAHK